MPTYLTTDELANQANVDPNAVKLQQDQYGITPEAAVGNVATNQAKPVSVLSSDQGLNTLTSDKAKLDSITAPSGWSSPELKTEIKPVEEKENPNQAINGATGQKFTLEEAMKAFGSDFTGLHQTSDGSYIADSEAMKRLGITGLDDGQSGKLSGEIQGLDDKISGLVDNFTNYNVQNDPTFQAQASGIHAEFDKLRQQMKQINYQRQRALETLGYRTGAAQYAGSIQMGIEGEELSQADERLAEITRQENAAIMQAKQAYESSNYTKFSQQVDALQKIRTNKADTLEAYNKSLSDLNKKMQDDAKFQMDILKWQSEMQDKKLGRELDFQKFGLESDKFGLEISKFEQDAKEAAQRMGLDMAQFDFQKEKFVNEFKFQERKFNEDIRQFGINKAMDKLKIDIGQSENELERQIKFQNLLNETPFGEKVTIGNMSGVGNKGAADLAKDKIAKQTIISDLQYKIKNIDALVNSPALDGLVGPSAFKALSRISLRSLTGEAQEFAAGVKQLTAQETLNELLNLKKAGGTLGALSDTERVMLQNAATKLGTWEVKDKNGLGTGRWNVSESAFKKELRTIQDLAKKALTEAQGGMEMGGQEIIDSFDSFWQSAPDSDLPKIENMLNDPKLGATEEERKQAIMEYYGSPGFSNVGGDTNQASRIAKAIKKVESGGNYQARGDSGEFGAYQFMPGTWKSWAGKYLGNSNAKMSKENQDKVAIARINDLLEQGYNEEQIALIWNGGQPIVKKGVNKFGIKYDSGAYARKVLAALS